MSIQTEKKVIIYQYRLLHYRTELFDKLKVRCKKDNIELVLIHGQATNFESLKKDEGFLPWAIPVKNKYFRLKSRDILWQPVTKNILNADLVIFMQENRLISNYFIQFLSLFLKYKTAYWGHGYNFQSSNPNGLREKWKRFLVKSVDWWFAYTEMTSNYVLESSFPLSKITCLNNSIDTDHFKKQIESIQTSDLDELREQLGIQNNAQTALFCGSLYRQKRIDIIIESALLIKKRVPNFHLIVIGDGPLKPELVELAKEHTWIHVVGVKNGIEKAKYFKLASIMFNPGLVGLHIVDAFCASLVMVTLKDSAHSPEIAYLEDKKNGLIVDGGSPEYAEAIINLYNNPQLLDSMRINAKQASNTYTLDNMVENFAQGIKRAIYE
jgi:L-malate glycosyltransferase